MTPKKPAVPSIPLIAVAIGAMLAAGPAAADEQLPIYITGSQTFQHDSNLFRDRDDRASSDTVSITGVKLGLDKSYGRQRYRASALYSINRYRNNSQLDINAHEVEASLDTEVGSDFYGSLSLSDGRSQAPFDVGGTQRLLVGQQNVQSTRSLDASGRYGLYGKWSLEGALSRFEQDYTVTRWYYPKRTATTAYGGVRYSPTDTLSFGVGLRNVPGRTTYFDDADNLISDKTRSRNIDFSTRWLVTGLSLLDARISATRTTHSLQSQAQRAVTGRLDWNYTPQGLLSYNVYIRRDNSNNGYFNSFVQTYATSDSISFGTLNTTNGTLTNEVGGRIRWDVTSKIGVLASASYASNRVDTTYVDTTTGASTAAAITTTSNFSSLGLTVQYSPIRWLDLSCSVRRLNHTADQNTLPYSANVMGCTASATLNAPN